MLLTPNTKTNWFRLGILVIIAGLLMSWVWYEYQKPFFDIDYSQEIGIITK